MPYRRFLRRLPAAAAAVLFAGCVSPQVARDLLGTPAAYAPGIQTVTITPATQWVNVTGGDTVRFVAGAVSFTWNFQVGVTVSRFDLNRIAPPGMLARPVAVYVAPNPLYLSNS